MDYHNQNLLKRLLEAIKRHPDFKSNQEFTRLLQTRGYTDAVKIVEQSVKKIEDNTVIIIPDISSLNDNEIREQQQLDTNNVFIIPKTGD